MLVALPALADGLSDPTEAPLQRLQLLVLPRQVVPGEEVEAAEPHAEKMTEIVVRGMGGGGGDGLGDDDARGPKQLGQDPHHVAVDVGDLRKRATVGAVIVGPAVERHREHELGLGPHQLEPSVVETEPVGG